MPIINREMDATERRQAFYESYGASGFPVGTGFTLPVAVLPMNGLISSLFAAASGVSGTPAYNFNLYRFNATGGFTSIPVTNSTLTPAAYGTSGPAYVGPSYMVQAATFLVAGQTVIAGDVLVVQSSGSNAAALSVTFGVTVQATDDYVKYLGT